MLRCPPLPRRVSSPSRQYIGAQTRGDADESALVAVDDVVVVQAGVILPDVHGVVAGASDDVSMSCLAASWILSPPPRGGVEVVCVGYVGLRGVPPALIGARAAPALTTSINATTASSMENLPFIAIFLLPPFFQAPGMVETEGDPTI